MKSKFFAITLGIATMLTGCNQESTEPALPDSQTKAIFSVAVNDGIQTRSVDSPTRYVMEVYEIANDNDLAANDPQQRIEQASGTFNISLKDGQKYVCLFWADYGTAKTADTPSNGDYDVADLKKAAVKANTIPAKPAFCSSKRFTYTAGAENPDYANVELTHAVAKVNYVQTENFTRADNKLEVTFPKTFAINVDGNAVTEIQNSTASVPVTHTFTGIGQMMENQTIGTSYLIAAELTKTVMDITMKFNVDERIMEMTGVPFQHNYQTNIKGAYSDLYQASFTFDFTEAWSTPDKDKEIKWVTGIALYNPTLSLKVGEVNMNSVTVTPSDAANKNVTWTSSNTAVATVDSTQKITGVSAGTATITATTVDGGFTASCEVTVTAN